MNMCSEINKINNLLYTIHCVEKNPQIYVVDTFSDLNKSLLIIILIKSVVDTLSALSKSLLNIS